MGRSGSSFFICAVGILIILACVFGDTPSGDGTVKVEKLSDGLSTSKDTVKEESESIYVEGLSASELKKLRESAEKREFQAEVLRMMQLIVNSLYKNKEIFLRELISNASDALDKIRMLSLTDGSALKATDELAIRIKVNKDARTLHIVDTGIGMTKEELAANLGTIAKSGTSEFRTNVTDPVDATDLIGQFGVGFYSAFLVSKRVMVISKSNNDKQHIWESDSQTFSLTEDPRGDTLKRGTEIILHLSEEADDYLQVETLKGLVKKYSQFVNFPIYLWSSRVEKVQEEKTEVPADESKDEASVEEEKKAEPKMVEKTVWEWVHINKQKPIWKRKPADITEEEYKSLYQALSNDEQDPLGKLHFTAEGDVTFTSVVFIPKRSQGDVFNPNYNYNDRIKLHVHRVFISDAAQDLIPKYLGFVRGIVDSDDLPVNVSRETLQQNQLVKLIKKKLVRRILDAISKLPTEDYEKFWKEYSVHIKLGLLEDSTNKVRLSKLLRFRTSKSPDKPISLDEYVGRMKKDQDSIFYLSGASLDEVQKSPLAERLIKKGFEVIYMIDPLDEYLVQTFNEFEGKSLQSVAKEGVVLDKSGKSAERREAYAKEFADLLKWLKEDALKDLIEKAELSERLSESPCALIASSYGWSGNMERILRAQAHHKGDDSSSDFYWKMPKTLEINPRHPLIKELNSRIKSDASDKEAKQTAELLYYVASLRSGYAVRDSVDFANKIEVIMRKNLAIDESEKVEEELEEPIESDEEVNKVNDEEAEEKNTESPSKDKITEENNSSTTDEQASCGTCRKLLQWKSASSAVDENDSDDDDDDEEEEENDDDDDSLFETGDLIGNRHLLAVKPTSIKKPITVTKSKVTNPAATEKKSMSVKKKPAPVVKPAAQLKSKVATAPKPVESGTQPPKMAKPSKKQPIKPAASQPQTEHSNLHAQPKGEFKLTIHAFKSHMAKKPKTTPKPKPIRVVRTPNDHDCDGIPDDIDEDIDNDGLLDRTQDSDWDGELNHVDLDDDNDGIPDTEDDDANGDGIPDCRADTSDHQLVVRFRTKKRKIDSDLDGIPDDVDGDDDDDGIPDIMEDEDEDQIPDMFNLSKSDLLSMKDMNKLAKHLAKHGWHDHDCDGIPDHLDPDDDNDGFFDNKQDSDRDGILNEWDDDDDNDGIPDSEDPDSNGDGIPDCIIKDTDGDGIPDHIDTDDDNDGIPDLHDPDHPTFNYFKDSDNDGIPDVLDKDDDNDGIPDHNDQDSDGDGTHDFFQDLDKDGVPDSLDDDMDNDGIPDHLQDHDCDGIPDIIDPDDDNDGYFDNKQDSDNDGILNEWDDDDDNDGIPDKDDEDSNGDGIIDCQPRDADGDGIPDHLDDDDDNDGIPDHQDPDSMSFLLYKHKRFLEAIPAEIARNQANLMNVDLGDPNDKDCDGIPDHLDNDMDNDGKIDRTQDSDMDGLLNHVDDDDDNDGIPDHLDPDANGDGIPDCRRDDDLHYKLVRSPSGLIKKVLRIRKPTQEEQHLTFMVNEAKRKLIKVRAMMNSPPPRRPLQTVPATTPSTPLFGDDEEEELEEEPLVQVKPNHPKMAPAAAAAMKKNAPKSNVPADKMGKPTATDGGPGKTKTPMQHRKLTAFTDIDNTLDDYHDDDSEDYDSEEDDELEDQDSGLGDEEQSVESEGIGSFMLPGAVGAEPQPIKKPTPAKANKEAQPKKAKSNVAIESVKVPKKPNTAGGSPLAAQSSMGKKHASKEANTCKAKTCETHTNVKPVAAVKTDKAKAKVASIPAKQGKTVTKPKSVPKQATENDIDDEDGDGIPDYLEGDSDGDGIPDYMEDEDGDGIPDYLEDEDGDGIPDYLDDDSSYKIDDDDDNDGIKDVDEDVNHNQKLDILEAKDSDGDGIPDYLDDDDDNDGIPDDLDDDDDGDGIPDQFEDENENQIPDYLEMTDSDGDGIVDWLDTDDDNDNIPDYLDDDDDGDGIPDVEEDENHNNIPDILELKMHAAKMNKAKMPIKPTVRKVEQKVKPTKPEDEDEDDDDDDDDDNELHGSIDSGVAEEDYEDEPQPSKLRMNVNRVLRWLESFFGTEQVEEDEE